MCVWNVGHVLKGVVMGGVTGFVVFETDVKFLL